MLSICQITSSYNWCIIWGVFNKFQDCSSQWAHSDSWKPKLLWSCTATIVHHLLWFHLWRHTVWCHY